ncbi:uncharacterized protein KY384_006027 [Bacidia gigantensis]|uniref:uncharacterized protein n=1 Tax=Bacidia gigantensis TaxID=2732470 RepID=UPI001D05744F|nr:uncharacterized protein KY384_006027 [Bacidia gigantensis]KAG8529391.1 hypothetical protein KY384_006027 [Bacidia gigantensis]
MIEATGSNEMVALHEFNESNVSHFLFDGIVSHEGKGYYLEHVPFNLLSIGGYEDTQSASVDDNIWIQSLESRRTDVWYRVRRPKPEYQRYHNWFLWMADLAKHVIDYMFSVGATHLLNYQSDFDSWLAKTYPFAPSVKNWRSQYGDRDFRRVIANQAVFLHCQASQVNETYLTQPLWQEIHPKHLSAVPKRVERRLDAQQMITSGKGILHRKTTVTPYVYECFKSLPWARYLHLQEPSGLNFANGRKLPNIKSAIKRRGCESKTFSNAAQVGVGDVVAIPPDQDSVWKTKAQEWYAYVQSIDTTPEGFKLGLLWLYEPGDTACMKMRYPFANELFLSDHCNCGDAASFTTDIIRQPLVDFYGCPESNRGDFFCRQRYVADDAEWVTLEDAHFQCACKTRNKPTRQFLPGQTILYTKRNPGKKSVLEPAVIASYDPFEKTYRVRLLLRRRRDFGVPLAALNELVYTNRFDTVPLQRVDRPCHVRFYPCDIRDTGDIAAPYNRQGQGDHYFICSMETNGTVLENLRFPRSEVIQGWDPIQCPTQKPLRTLDVFCGGGNFGRGIEEAGVAKCEWAVDHCSEAINTYKANMFDPNTKLFHGSVNQYLSEALRGNEHDGLVAQVGEVEFVIAGSPCQGFSLLNPIKGNEGGLLNESLVASVVSFIDFYRPKHALLENVKGMAYGPEDKNVLAAVLSPQARTRIFISVTAPGTSPLREPLQTHGHPESVMAGSLGRTANGLKFGARLHVRTPFSYVSAEQATADLPSIDAGVVPIAFPDHRMSRTMSVLNKTCISCVPRFPEGQGFLASYKKGWIPQIIIDNFSWTNHIRTSESSKAWTRLRRKRLFPTITTAIRPEDGVGGTCLHWDDHRLLTILEARRGQGVPDTEVILGSIADQFKIVGNSVARPVALALGLSLREAWLKNVSDEASTLQNLASVEESMTSKLNATSEWTFDRTAGGQSSTHEVFEIVPRLDSASSTSQSSITSVIEATTPTSLGMDDNPDPLSY